MKTLKIMMIFFVALLLVADVAHSQERKAGLTGATFLKIGVGAREVALGTAVAALSGNPNQMFYNPAGIVMKEGTIQASFNYNKWIADIGHSSAAVTYNWEGVGTIGVGFITFGLSNISADRDVYTDPFFHALQVEQNTSSTYDYRDMAYQLSYAKSVMDNLSLGVTLKGITESIDGTSINAFAVDFGSVYNIGVLDWSIAARMQNLGSDMKFNDIPFGLPLTFSIGTAIVPVKMENNKLMLALDAVKSQDGPQYFFGGAELSFLDMVALRGGYKFNYSGTNDGGTSSRSSLDNTIEGYSLGAGIRSTVSGYTVAVDYAYSQMKILDNVHRFSVMIGVK